MNTVRGIYAEAKILADDVEDYAEEQGKEVPYYMSYLECSGNKWKRKSFNTKSQ